MDLNHSSCWDSILEKAKSHIPSIDFDSTSSENEEMVTIYQRPAGLSLTIPHDFDLFSMDDDELEGLLKPAAQTYWSEESVKLDDDESVGGTTATQWGTQHSGANVEASACERGILELNGAKKDASVKPNIDITKSDEGFPILSFAKLDQWDLDDVVINLQENGLSLGQCVSVGPSKENADGDKDRSQGNIMERLGALCKRQSSQSLPEPVKYSQQIRQNVCQKSSEGMAAKLQLSHQECPTVYIDLRCPDPSIKLPRKSPNFTSESKLPAKHSTHQKSPPAKKNNFRLHAGSKMGDREMTGKNTLLQKIREMKTNGNKYPNKHPPYSVTVNEAEVLQEKRPQPVESLCSNESHHLLKDKHYSYVQVECRNPKIESQPTTQQSATKKTKQQSYQQRQRVKKTLQQEQHQQISKKLEIQRPTQSVNQKQMAAEKTDVLYDFEVSHLQSISTTLPADTESKGCMLLIVDLFSPGVVGALTHGRKRHLNPAPIRSDLYNALVAWFLSLVGPEPHHDEDVVGAEVPFWVAGLQQLWTEDGLALHVLVVARHSYTPRKRDIDIHAPFYNHVCRFLSETKLSVIMQWLPQLNNLLDQKAYSSPVNLPSSSLNCFISTTSNKKVIDRTFGLSPGFYWQTVETQEHVCKGRETTQELHTEVSVAVGNKDFFLHPLITHYTLQLVLESGLDVCGLRLLYTPQGFLSESAGAIPVIQRSDDACQPLLALAVRGLHAHSVLKDLTHSLDPLMPRKTDLKPLLYCPQLASQVHRELCLWFSGRLQGGSSQYHSQSLKRVEPSEDRVRGSLCRPPAFLCATTKADLVLVVSPAVPPCCYSQVLAVCERRGFSLLGLQKLQLQSNSAAVLGLTSQQALVFCSSHTVTRDQGQLEWHSHCLVLLLRKENAVHHSGSLSAALMREFKAQNPLNYIHSDLDGIHRVEPNFCFHIVPYSSNLLSICVKHMWEVPEPSSVILSRQKYSSNSDMEQVVILTLCGKNMSQGLSLVHRVLTEKPEGFKLLGLKWLPALTRLQAQEISPYEVGEHLYHHSLDTLMSSPVLVYALRRVDAFASLRKLLPLHYPGNPSVLMSPTPEVALRQATIFFFKHEIISDPSVRPVMKFPSGSCSTKDPQMMLTVCLLKPKFWSQTLVKIVQLTGLTLVGLHVRTLDRSNASSLLPAERDHTDLEAHVEYLCSGSYLALCLQGENAVRRLLDVLGQEGSSLWAYDGVAHLYKGIYGSGSYQKAIEDVKRLFPEGLCCTETNTMRQEQILSMYSDPLASTERQQSCTLAPVAQESLSPSVVSEQNGGIHSVFWQTTCLLIPLNAPPLSPVPPQLDMLEQLLRSGCHLVAGRMSMLDNEQRKDIAATLNVSSGEDERMSHLSKAPCLIIALQGKEIVTCFNQILERIYKERPDLEKVGRTIIYTESQKQANQLICYLFNALSPESNQAIVP